MLTNFGIITIMKVINLFGEPGAGKSTTALGLAYFMSRSGISNELVTEYPKELFWEDRQNMLTEQDYIFAKQHRRLRRLISKVDYATTDSPLPLIASYTPDDFPPTFIPTVMDMFSRYHNVNFFIEREHQFDPSGRFHTEEQAEVQKEKILTLLEEYDIQTVHVASDTAVEEILAYLDLCH